MKKGDLRKLQILEAAIRCLAEKGWAHTNYETVGRFCQMKRPHVAYHYPKWDDLLFSALRFVYATGQSVVGDFLREAKGSRERLKAYVEGTFHWFATYPHHGASVTLLPHLASVDGRYRVLNAEMKRLGMERVHAILFSEAVVDLKSARWTTALNAHALLTGRCLELLGLENPADHKRLAVETVEAMWSLAQGTADSKRKGK